MQQLNSDLNCVQVPKTHPSLTLTTPAQLHMIKDLKTAPKPKEEQAQKQQQDYHHN
jgi:hypothetical protein